MASAFYTPTGDPDRFVATEHTAGPWDPAAQHGGPPSALLARAIEREPSQLPSTVVRMVVDLLGPVPVGEVAVSSTIERSGRSVELVAAELVAGGRPAARARGWRVRRAELELPAAVTPPSDAPSMPADDTSFGGAWSGGFLHAMQLRFLRGGWDDLGPATVWARQRVPLVDGEEPSGLQRLMALADCGNGVSSTLPISDWLFINPDLTVHLSRYPAGEWLCIDAATTVDPAGFGVAASTLYDASGRVGHGTQSLYVAPR
ncbi:MAG TPA: thioesterase family protein [Mycobacteriales bacterium]|nr:thioesterase family protein [Mycobacteriales bacterium]